MVAMGAVILARGLGTRMQAADPDAPLSADQARAADAGQKAMMPIGGRPFLDYVLSAVADAGLSRAALVVAPQHAGLRRYYEETARPSRLALDFVVQPLAAGTADAVRAAEAWARGEPFLVLNGDNLYPTGALSDLAGLTGPGVIAFDREALVRSGTIDPARIRAFAVLDVNGDGYLRRVNEKPSAEAIERAGPHAGISMNCWRFDDRIFEACRDVPPSPRGELELPAAVNLAIERGMRCRVVPSSRPVLDLSRRADTAVIASRLAGLTPRP